jgi:hypothetical protein
MTSDRTYTERIAVRMPAEIREKIEKRLGDTRLSAALRDAALRSIGRGDLVVATEPGPQRPRKPGATWVVIPVPATVQQKKALGRSAKAQKIALSTLMLDALLAELRLATREASRGWRRGWELGRRRSSPPKD